MKIFRREGNDELIIEINSCAFEAEHNLGRVSSTYDMNLGDEMRANKLECEEGALSFNEVDWDVPRRVGNCQIRLENKA